MMQNNYLRRLILIAGFLLLICAGCDNQDSQAEETNTIQPNPVKAPPALIEKIKATGWLESRHTCSNMSMTKQDYEDCLQVEAALLPSFDSSKRDHFGEEYNPKKYFDCRVVLQKGNTDCNKYKLYRDEPEPVWPYPDVPPFQWPEAPKDQVYKKGMSSAEYFDALCKAEAGKFIYKTIDDVEGIYQIRPLKDHQSNVILQDRYVFESPYQQAIDSAKRPGLNLLGPDEYLFVETVIYEPRSKTILERSYDSSFLAPVPEGEKYIRYEGEAYRDFKNVKKKYVAELRSQYGYVWRGIRRPHDREHAIAGGELAIVDLKTNKILALWRGFIRSGSSKSKKVWWLSGQACPKIYGDKDMLDKFMVEVLKPKKKESTKEGEAE